MSSLVFNFEYNGKAHMGLIVFKKVPPMLPNIGELVLFNEDEAKTLEQNGLPARVWRVRARAFDYGNGEQERVTITLESRSAKGARALAVKKSVS
ncbi:hypothetical protein Y695_00176 [Hydrogenophaga sp. T4]|nr:hypothetical protein Y695_00176 [Hydrogenophaga sp. T4]